MNIQQHKEGEWIKLSCQKETSDINLFGENINTMRNNEKIILRIIKETGLQINAVNANNMKTYENL
jgi:hypothetical protein